MLSRTARLMIPFYRQIAGNRSYALRWSQAVRTGNIQAMERLFRRVVLAADTTSLSTNGIGYFVDVPFPKPVFQ
ncbi:MULTISPECIES: hypothetical protein [unclassified Paenibacillus]|uniref:hypothetical protein n=1 Tax=unclassified Paenibacillus TaxID=185978 RepID=UPI001AE6FC82|nr:MULTISPECIES: hypothetical protein [unclassified Paenibacillus]MBP1157050.1 hypothetical protein [Paenibacillus sp. PvP091]MBP1172211.1 hypothetical protein [Paenibacillus sp. PvR098]MBP2438592.1 hypothetical protein [Paenibacillus sp. PvP052]